MCVWPKEAAVPGQLCIWGAAPRQDGHLTCGTTACPPPQARAGPACQAASPGSRAPGWAGLSTAAHKAGQEGGWRHVHGRLMVGSLRARPGCPSYGQSEGAGLYSVEAGLMARGWHHAHHAHRAQHATAQRTSGPDLCSTPGSPCVRPAAGCPLAPPTTGPAPAACAGTIPGAAVVVVAVGTAEMPPPLTAAACCAWAAATAAPTVAGTGVGPVPGEACGDRSSCTCA